MNAFPRLTIRHTSSHHIGQVYIPGAPPLTWQPPPAAASQRGLSDPLAPRAALARAGWLAARRALPALGRLSGSMQRAG